jgi:uncharacterized membrane protein
MEDGAASNLPENQPATWQADVIPEESHTFTISAQTWIGPLPDPVTMERYERLAPGAAERFLGMMEGEVIHRQVMDNRESRRQDWGLAAAFIVVILIVAAGTGLIYLGNGWAGAAVIGINVVGLAAVFITGGIRRRAGSVQSDNSDDLMHD